MPWAMLEATAQALVAPKKGILAAGASALAILVGGGGASGINALGRQPGGPRLEWLGPGICAGRACAGEP